MKTPTTESAKSASIVSINFPGFLRKLTGARLWDDVDAPESGCGLDYCFATPSGHLQAHCNLDQEHLTVTVSTVDGDEVESWSGELSDAYVKHFVARN